MSLLLLFTDDTDPDLPHLYVADPETGQNVPVGGRHGADGDFLQSTALAWVPLEMSTELVGAGPSTSDYFYTRRATELIVSAGFSTAAATAVIRPIYSDVNDVNAYGPSVTVTALSYQEGAKYMSEIVTFKTYGADRMSVIIESVSAGTIDLHQAAV
jgi:hypothetical protein